LKFNNLNVILLTINPARIEYLEIYRGSPGNLNFCPQFYYSLIEAEISIKKKYL